ncbi:B-cell receptor CD22 [Merluccius polli]|uniref:B-cell receptor CD22 n=1 Tax=Merluccius polli TaxID=89951 RepID=A0AA47P7Y6_MERPO|nr:B-cell receptor CD22 [Merluccius polli]
MYDNWQTDSISQTSFLFYSVFKYLPITTGERGETNYELDISSKRISSFPSVSTRLGNDDWRVTYTSSNVCILRGSTVEISCTYNTLKNKMAEIPQSRKHCGLLKETEINMLICEVMQTMQIVCGENSCTRNSCNGKCTLRIRDLRLSDSAAEYKFQFITNQPGGKYTGDPGVTLSVTDLQVKVSFPNPTHFTWADLECHSMCGLAGPYIWTRRGQSVKGGRIYRGYIGSEDIFSCAVQGYEHLPSPPVYALKTPSVTVRPSGEIEEGSSVTLSCSSDANPAANYTWFKDNTDDSSRYMNQGQQLVFDRIKSSDSGKYLCEAKNEFGTKSASISINMGPKHTSVISSPSGGVKEGSSVTLSCSSDANPAAKYTWFKNNQTLLWNPIQRYTFTSVHSEDRGTYRCQAENKYGRLSSNWVFIDVQYGPKHTSVISSPSGGVKEGSSVTLSCSSDANPAANYTWFKDNTDDSSRYMNQGQQLVFGHIKSSDSGKYLCEAQNELGTKSASISINVKYGPKHTSVISSPSGGVEEGSSVTLSCSSDANPAAKYTWFKEHEDSVIESGQNYTITNITSELGGNYYCQAHNAIGCHNSTFLSISVTETSLITAVAVGIIVVSLATILLLLFFFLWMRRTRASRTASGLGEAAETVGESLPVHVYENISALTNSSSPSVQREPIELQDLLCPIRSETAGPVLCGQL